MRSDWAPYQLLMSIERAIVPNTIFPACEPRDRDCETRGRDGSSELRRRACQPQRSRDSTASRPVSSTLRT